MVKSEFFIQHLHVNSNTHYTLLQHTAVLGEKSIDSILHPAVAPLQLSFMWLCLHSTALIYKQFSFDYCLPVPAEAHSCASFLKNPRFLRKDVCLYSFLNGVCERD